MVLKTLVSQPRRPPWKPQNSHSLTCIPILLFKQCHAVAWSANLHFDVSVRTHIHRLMDVFGVMIVALNCIPFQLKQFYIICWNEPVQWQKVHVLDMLSICTIGTTECFHFFVHSLLQAKSPSQHTLHGPSLVYLLMIQWIFQLQWLYLCLRHTTDIK